jgi:hypothetical protein
MAMVRIDYLKTSRHLEILQKMTSTEPNEFRNLNHLLIKSLSDPLLTKQLHSTLIHLKSQLKFIRPKYVPFDGLRF